MESRGVEVDGSGGGGGGVGEVEARGGSAMVGSGDERGFEERGLVKRVGSAESVASQGGW